MAIHPESEPVRCLMFSAANCIVTVFNVELECEFGKTKDIAYYSKRMVEMNAKLLGNHIRYILKDDEQPWKLRTSSER